MAEKEIKALSKISQKEIDRYRWLRWKARTDLGFLCREILGYKDVSDEIHGPLMSKLQKFPYPNAEQFRENDKIVNGTWVYKPIKKMTELEGKRRLLILDSRGFLKSTINAKAHTIQWIINYPDIAIMILQSNLEKAEMVVGEIKNHFKYNEEFRLLFPEHCPTKNIDDFGTKGKFTTKARGRYVTRTEETVTGLSIDAGTAGIHVDLMKFSDIVEPSNVGTPEQMTSVTNSFYMSHNLLVGPNYWIDVEGTRYDFCFRKDTKITLSDWTTKNIEDIQVGDEVVGWRRKKFVRTKVLNVGKLKAKTNKYTLKSGQSFICTPQHKFWTGNDYKEIQELKFIKKVLTNHARNDASGYLAGIYDAEGCGNAKKLVISQSEKNAVVIDKIRQELDYFNFKYLEQWYKPKNRKYKSCSFIILGGWSERHRFLLINDPVRKHALIEGLYGRFSSEDDEIINIEEQSVEDVYWFETETGNYIAEGYCSKNSDCYGTIIDKKKNTPEFLKGSNLDWEIYARGCYQKDTGSEPPKYTPEELDLPDKIGSDGKPILTWSWPERGFSYEAFELKRLEDPYIFSSQLMNSPKGGIGGRDIFPVDNKYPAKISRKAFNENVRVAHYVATVDTAETTNDRSNYSVITVAAFASDGRVYVNEIVRGKFLPHELVELICGLTSLKREPYVYGHKLSAIQIEETSFVRGLRVALDSYQQLNGIYLPIQMIKRDNRLAKLERIQNTLQPPYMGKRIIFLDDLAQWDNLVGELRQFPKSQSDDILDTLADLFQNKEWFGREFAKPSFEQYQADAWEKMLGVDLHPALQSGASESSSNDWYSKSGGL